ncbi:hypothetical protein OS493_026761 [Desmophyllum pertusum]|uniref:Uncharacterized protein n=1 Tax=Desmophyllum pertusum TaxID=174260 RepID=A0A9X0D2R3_9CNID|nr:hypothetical protein OS493_026761 [Desmophyllum pertusum]
MKTSMSAGIEHHTDAASMRVAQILTALTPVAAVLVSKVTGCHVVISMSAQRVPTIVIGQPCALTLGAHIAVHVLKDITEMANSAVKVNRDND